jgi:hypothetical protein
MLSQNSIVNVMTTKHRVDPTNRDHCVCGAEVVYREDTESPGYGCDVEGRPFGRGKQWVVLVAAKGTHPSTAPTTGKVFRATRRAAELEADWQRRDGNDAWVLPSHFRVDPTRQVRS